MTSYRMAELRNCILTALAEEGCSTSEQKVLLEELTGQTLSLRQIQRINKAVSAESHLSHKRVMEESALEDIERTIRNELEQPGGTLLGYRGMWLRLRHTHKLKVKRKTVMVLLSIIDPENTSQRASRRLKRRIYRSKGPNFAWHCDGYDKLKPFGLPIHGCIDGYSRKVLWLEIADSNNDPMYIAHYYLNCVQTLGGCPRVLRTDLGTENSNIAFIQPLLRHDSLDTSCAESHIYGKSTSNQRIESFWSQLRKHLIEWWIDFFKTMQVEGHFNAAIPYHVHAVRYTFGILLKKELDRFLEEWNSHRIRPSKMAETPAGIPNVLYQFPQLRGNRNYLHLVNSGTLQTLRQYSREPTLVSSQFKNMVEAFIEEHNLQNPVDFTSALQLYFSIIELIDYYE